MILNLTLLIAGLLLILLGANYLVDGASSIAKRFGLSEFIIGVTIVGIGTSAPEMVVSFMSAFQGKADMAIGNIVGSNIFNTAMILGVTALISPLVITRSNMKKDIPLNIMVTVLLIVLGMNFTLTGLGKDQLSRIDGLVLLGIFAWYLWSSFRSDSVSDDEEDDGSASGAGDAAGGLPLRLRRRCAGCKAHCACLAAVQRRGCKQRHGRGGALFPQGV